ncbi:MAG: MFS transporter, partial [Pelagibacterales bacterium]|nr:MFS transporter [Pelagibacterales bacterium]
NSNQNSKKHLISESVLPKKKIAFCFFILVILIFSKFFYLESIKTYYTFYLIHNFGISIKLAQIHLFIFLLATVIGVLIGVIIGDKYGRKLVIWFSILGALPLTLIIPYCNLFWTAILIFFVGLIISSAFSAILVYVQEILPGRVGMVSGLFFGIGFGMAGIAAALLGKIADLTSIEFVYKICSFLPTIGLCTYFLPDIEKKD